MSKILIHKNFLFLILVGLIIPLFLLISLSFLLLIPGSPKYYYSNTHIVFPTTTSEDDKDNVYDLCLSDDYKTSLYQTIISDESYDPSYEVNIENISFRWTVDNYRKDVLAIEFNSFYSSNVSLTIKKSAEVLLDKVSDIGIDKNKLTVHGNQDYTFSFDDSKDSIAVALIIPAVTIEFCLIASYSLYLNIKNKKAKLKEMNI